MDTLGFGQHLVMDYQRMLRRAEARERLSLEEQAARGLWDDEPAHVRQEQGWGRVRLWKMCAWILARLWRSGVEVLDESSASRPA